MPVLDLLGAKRRTIEVTDADHPGDTHPKDAVCQEGNWEGEGQSEEPRPALPRGDRPDEEEGSKAEKSWEEQATSVKWSCESSLTNRA